MSHECPVCGDLCYCDEEDMEHADAPDDCEHLCRPSADEIDEWDEANDDVVE